MLPINSTDITISAYFICDGNIINNKNPLLSEFLYNGNPEDIKFLNLEVEYLGECDVAIDWIRIETPHSQELFRGYKDSLIVNKVQDFFNYYTDTSYKNKGTKPFRIYTRDEPKSSFWAAMRYINKLVGNIGTTQEGIHYAKHYEYYVNPPEMWLSYSKMIINLPPPYIRHRDLQAPSWIDSMGFWRGFWGKNYSDTISSGYETFIDEGYFNTLKNYNDDSIYYVKIKDIWSFQSGWDRITYEMFNKFKPNLAGLYGSLLTPQYELLFSNKPWWAEVYVSSDWTLNSPITVKNPRPESGEEFRLQAWLPIILGAKGLIYDRDQHDDAPPHHLGIGHGQKYYEDNNLDTMSNAWDFLTLDEIGSDFITDNTSQDYTGLDALIPSGWGQKHGHESNRHYLGRESERRELYKIHKWIRANEDELLKLKLVTLHNKGFKTWRTTDPSFDSNILDSFIDTAKIYTRPIGRTIDNVPLYEQGTWDGGERYDSAFYDITLLRYEDDDSLNSQNFILGIQNRRTDPLIYYTDPDDTTKKYMRFLSTAEFEDSCMSADRDTAKFQSYWWKRLGSREITIPIKYTQNPNADEFTVFKVSELGANDTNLTKLPWRDPKYYHTVDTMILNNHNLVVRLLPGEGKMLKFQVSYSQMAGDDFAGFLNHTNQKKVVAYPSNFEDVNERDYIDSVRYHCVYHRVIPGTNPDTLGVYYRRSFPMPASYPMEAIRWEPPPLGQPDILVSKFITIRDNLCNSLPGNARLICAYPSIVVRYNPDIDSAMVYIVYSAKCSEVVEACGSNQIYIVENTFPANRPSLGLDVPNGLVMSRAVTLSNNDLSKWGTPMINASSNGNYYCWSDRNRGIVVAFKTPNDNSCFARDTNYHFDTLSSPYYAQYPSLNSYSKLRWHEDNCALVWAERPRNALSPVDKYYHIYYTRLKADANGYVRNYMPGCTYSGTQAYFNSDGTIMQISKQPGQDTIAYYNCYPVVYRDVEEWKDSILNAEFPPCIRPGYDPGDSCLVIDRIFWSGYDTYLGYNRKVIFTKYLHQLDTAVGLSYYPAGYWRSSIYNYMSQSLSLYQPTVAQGSQSLYKWSGDTTQYFNHENDSICVLNFSGYGTDSIDSTAKIWQIFQGYWDLAVVRDSISPNFEGFSRAKLIDVNGYAPQLAALPFIKWGNEWNFGRRIFNTGSDDPPTIISNLMYFYKKPEEEKDKSYIFSGYVYNNIRNMFSDFVLKDKNGNITSPKLNIWDKHYYGYNLRDTICTDWFNASDISKLNFFNFGTPELNFLAQIERQSDKKRFTLPMSYFSNGKFVKNDITLLNGGNNKYRFILEKLEPRAVFTETVVVDGLPDIMNMNAGLDDRKFRKDALIDNDAIIDLGEESYEGEISEGIKLNIYPNPIDDILYITAFLPNRFYVNQSETSEQIFGISIYSNIGNTLYETKTKPGETIRLSTKNYPNGVNFVRVEHSLLSPIVKPFMIKR